MQKDKVQELVDAQIAREKAERAAPELLAALIELEQYMTECGYFRHQSQMAKRARAAIRKAKGK